MSQVQSAVDSYIAAWNEGEADQRRSLVEEAFTAGAGTSTRS